MSTTYQTNLQSTDHKITISQASTLIGRFLDNRQGIIEGDYETIDPLSNSQTFDKRVVIDLLSQEGCIGLRAYFGMYDGSTTEDKKGKIVLVMCGVDEDGNDLNLAPETEYNNQIILQNAQFCPPVCSEPSEINNL